MVTLAIFIKDERGAKWYTKVVPRNVVGKVKEQLAMHPTTKKVRQITA